MAEVLVTHWRLQWVLVVGDVTTDLAPIHMHSRGLLPLLPSLKASQRILHD